MSTMTIVSAPSKSGAWLTLIKPPPVDYPRGCWGTLYVQGSIAGRRVYFAAQ